MRNITTSIMKNIGMLGSTGMRTAPLVPRSDTLQGQQDLFRDFTESGNVADPDIWSKFNQHMRRPATFDSMLQLWEDMSMWDLMAAALVEIVDEATQVDANSPATIWYQCNDSDFEDDLNAMLSTIGAEDIIASQVYYVAGLGNHFEKIDYAVSEGVTGLSFVHPFDVRRYWLQKNRKCIGYRWQDHIPTKDDVFVGVDNKTPIERVAIADGKNIEDLWYPWDFLHFRRMYRMRMNEHGEPLFAEAEGIYKKLKMAVDQMVVHRAQIQPDRYAINIDVKDQSPIEQMKTVQKWKQSLRHKIAFGQDNAGSTGGGGGLDSPEGFQSYYNAWSLDTILWIAKPNGFNHGIEKLQGTQNIPDVYDIELLTDLFYAVIGMPRAWFGPNRGQGSDSPSGKALLAQDMRFLRKIKSIRKPIVNCYTWLGYFHAILKGKNVSQLNIQAMMPPIGGLEEQMKLELLERQANILDVLSDVMAKYNLPKEAWIETIFKRYLHLPDEVVNVFITSLPAQEDAPTLESKGKGSKSVPCSYKLIREVEEKLRNVPGAETIVEELKTFAGVKYNRTQKVEEAMLRQTQSTFKSSLLESPYKTMNDKDIIVSSYGKDPTQVLTAMNLDKEDRPSGNKVYASPSYLAESKKNERNTAMDKARAKGDSPDTSTNINKSYRDFLPEKF